MNPFLETFILTFNERKDALQVQAWCDFIGMHIPEGLTKSEELAKALDIIKEEWDSDYQSALAEKDPDCPLKFNTTYFVQVPFAAYVNRALYLLNPDLSALDSLPIAPYPSPETSWDVQDEVGDSEACGSFAEICEILKATDDLCREESLDPYTRVIYKVVAFTNDGTVYRIE